MGCIDSHNLNLEKKKDLKSEIFLQVLQDHDEERQLDAQGLVWVRRARNIIRAYIRAHHFQDAGLDVLVSDAFDMTY